MNLNLPINDAYIPYLTNESRFLLLYGGASAGKSVFAAQKIIIRTITEKNHLFYAFRKVGETVRESVYQELLDAINDIGERNDYDLMSEFYVSEYNRSFLHKPTGNRIRCKGLDKVGKMKSVKGISGMWLDEVDQFELDDILQLNRRIRGEHTNYIQYVMTFNPIDENHWLKINYIDKKRDSVAFAHFTYLDNHFLSDDDKKVLEEFKDSDDEHEKYYYDVYTLGKWGILNKSKKFLYNFESYHINECKIDPHLPVKLSFDFNIDPFATVVYQRNDITINIIAEIRLDNSDIYEMCDHVLAKYPNAFFMITGDASGKNRSGYARGKTSYYRIIKKQLGLKDAQIKVRSRNLDLLESRILCNSALNNMDINIDPSCKNLVNDCWYAEVDDSGVLKKDRGNNKNDFLDGLRYLLDMEFPSLTRKPGK